MYWFQKYSPQSLDDVTYNKDIAGYLRKMIKNKHFMNFVLCGGPGSGKRTLVKLFLKEITTSENVMWINQGYLKTIESRDKLYTFIDSKSSIGKKWLVVENLNKMVVNFSNILFNILSSNHIYVCILETEVSSQVTPWCVIFNTHSPSKEELIETGKKMIEIENVKEKISEDQLEECAQASEYKIITFLFILQIIVEEKIDVKEFIIPEFDSENLLFHPSLRKRLDILMNYEMNGYSHLDIAIYLYNYIYNKSENIEICIELGDTVEHLTLYEHDSYYLYGTLCRIWEFTKNNNLNFVK